MKENGVGSAIHYVNQKEQQKDMHCTETLRVQGRRVDQEQLGKEQQNGNCGRVEEAGGRQKAQPQKQMEELHEGPMFHIRTKGENYDYDNNTIFEMFIAFVL